jgi:hypothetical protein
MCDFMYVYAWFYVSAYAACFLFEFFYNQYFILELYLVLWYDAELLDLDASLSETENPSLTLFAWSHFIRFLFLLFLDHYLKIRTSPKPYLHLFKNSETWQVD